MSLMRVSIRWGATPHIKDDVLQYAAKFESLKAQMETYDEKMMLMRFIFGLKDDLIEPVFMQYPKTVQEAKQVAETLG